MKHTHFYKIHVPTPHRDHFCKILLCFVTNTEERVEELVRELDEALRTKMLPTVRERNSIRGRLQFASSQMFGRKFRRVLKVLSNHVTQGRKTQSCLSDIRELLTQNTPRKIETSQAEVLHIYVDASFDYSDYSGVGGMIVDVSKKVYLSSVLKWTEELLTM